MTTLTSVREFLAQPRLALVGASRSGKKFGNTVVRELSRKGFQIALVHPEADEIDGLPCFSSVAELPEDVGGLVLVVPPDRAVELIERAAASGIRRVWLQQGAESPAAVERCRDLGIDVVHGECILMFADPTGIHRLHHWIWSWLGKLPKERG